VHGRAAHGGIVAVDLAHEPLHPLTFDGVGADAFAAGYGHLHHDVVRPRIAGHVRRHGGPLGQEVAERLEAHVHALGVVEPVHPDDHSAGRAQPPAQRRLPSRLRLRRDALELGDIDRHRIGPHPSLVVFEAHPGRLTFGSEQTPGDGSKVLGTHPPLEAHDVGGE